MDLVLTRPWGGLPNSKRGDAIDVDDKIAEFLLKVGGAVKPGQLNEGTSVAQTDSKPEPEPVSEPEQDAQEVKAPAKTASVDEWRKWGEAAGFDVKGLKKQEIIALSR